MGTEATINPDVGRNALTTGWPIVGWATLALSSMVLLTLLVWGVNEDAVHAVIRYTARSSLLLFGLAFVASSLRQLWPTPATRWLLVNRRYIGVSFAISHAMHMTGIIVLARTSSAFRGDVDVITLIFGGFGFVVAGVLAATSSNRAVATLGARRWRTLHKLGVYYLFFIFLVTYLPAAFLYPSYIGFIVILVAMLGLRFWAAGTAR